MASHELRIEPRVSEIPAVTDWVRERCGAAGLADDLTFKMTLVVEEAVINVINHAFAGRSPPFLLQVRLEFSPDWVAAEITDNGIPFDPMAVPVPDLPLAPEARRPGGLGIRLIRGLSDRLHYRRHAGNNVLRLEKSRR